MTLTEVLVNFLAYAILTVGWLMVWPSRRNIPALINIPFVITAYLAPLLVIPYSNVYSQQTLDLLTRINVLGAVATVFGLFVGYRARFAAPLLTALLPTRGGPRDQQRLRRRVMIALGLGVAGMALAFAMMGFVPMFADDPFLAKFFRGPYKDSYDRVAVLYRLSQFTVITLLPIAVAVAFERRNFASAALALSAAAVLGVSLTRAPVLEGVLLVLAIVASRSRKGMTFYLLGSTAIYVVGSVVYVVLGLAEGGDVVQNLSSGATDVVDHLDFLQNFNTSLNLTYGLSWVAGLLPGNQPYNPSVYSLSIVSPGMDLDDIRSGGLRLPASIWGYASFSWAGVVLVCFLSGLIHGGATAAFRSLISRETSLVNQTLLVLWFNIVVGFFADFYSMFYYGLLSIFLLLMVTRIKTSGRLVVQQRVTEP